MTAWDGPTFERHRRAVLAQLRADPGPHSQSELAQRLGVDPRADAPPLWLLLTALQAHGKVVQGAQGWRRP